MGKVWESGAVQVVQQAQSLSADVHPCNRLPGALGKWKGGGNGGQRPANWDSRGAPACGANGMWVGRRLHVLACMCLLLQRLTPVRPFHRAGCVQGL